MRTCDGYGAKQVGCQLDRGEDGGGTVGAADDAERRSFLHRECSRANGNEYNGEDAKLCRRSENRETQVAQHGTEVGERANTHEDYRRQESALYQHVVDEVHDSKLVGAIARQVALLLDFQLQNS